MQEKWELNIVKVCTKLTIRKFWNIIFMILKLTSKSIVMILNIFSVNMFKRRFHLMIHVIWFFDTILYILCDIICDTHILVLNCIENGSEDVTHTVCTDFFEEKILLCFVTDMTILYSFFSTFRKIIWQLYYDCAKKERMLDLRITS